MTTQFLSPLARVFHELLRRDRAGGRATGQPQGVEPEACLNGTSQGTTPEDARKDGHIIRARSAPLSPTLRAGSQFRGRSKLFMKHPGWRLGPNSSLPPGFRIPPLQTALVRNDVR
jgi:hypothetical protein